MFLSWLLMKCKWIVALCCFFNKKNAREIHLDTRPWSLTTKLMRGFLRVLIGLECDQVTKLHIRMYLLVIWQDLNVTKLQYTCVSPCHFKQTQMVRNRTWMWLLRLNFLWWCHTDQSSFKAFYLLQIWKKITLIFFIQLSLPFESSQKFL